MWDVCRVAGVALLVVAASPLDAAVYPGGDANGGFGFPAIGTASPAFPLMQEGIHSAALMSLDNVRLWHAFTAGHSGLAANLALGTQALDAGAVSLTFGVDAAIGPLSLAGFSASLGRQTFSGSGGRGESNDVALTLYGRKEFSGTVYATAALGYGWHGLETQRGFFFDPLSAAFKAQDYGGRLEVGTTANWTDFGAFAPFAALVGDTYYQPAYAESSFLGYSPFAVSYVGQTFNTGHVELGMRYGNYLTVSDWTGSVDAQLSWQHQLDGAPFIKGAYVNFDDSNFALPGTQPAENTLLLGIGLRLQGNGPLSFGIRADSRIGKGTSIHSGTMDVAYRW